MPWLRPANSQLLLVCCFSGQGYQRLLLPLLEWKIEIQEMNGTKSAEPGRSKAELASELQAWSVSPHLIPTRPRKEGTTSPLSTSIPTALIWMLKIVCDQETSPFPGIALYSLQSLIMLLASWNSIWQIHA